MSAGPHTGLWNMATMSGDATLGPKNPVLEDYRSDPGEGFWKKFPVCNLPEKAMSPTVIGALKAKIVENSSAMLSSEIERGEKVIENLKNGASFFQKGPLPSCYVDNTASTFKNGESVTDVVASWVKAGFAAGPFPDPLMPGFRVNSLAAIPQGEKVRSVLNVSLPKNLSFNSNVKEESLEKVFLTFPYGLWEACLDGKTGHERCLQKRSMQSNRLEAAGLRMVEQILYWDTTDFWGKDICVQFRHPWSCDPGFGSDPALNSKISGTETIGQCSHCGSIQNETLVH
jgi:hypothetical protein